MTLGEQTVKVQDELEPELKKLLEEIVSNTEKVPTDKISFEEPEDGGIYSIFGFKANRRINNINQVKCNNSLRYNINIYYPEDIESKKWTEQQREKLFFVISFSKNLSKYKIVVNSADSKHFANYEVTVYMSPINGDYPLYSRVAYYFLSALTEQEEYKVIDGLMERVKRLTQRHSKTRGTVTTRKQEFLSIISDVVNTGNVK